MVKLAGNVSPLARNLVEVSITFASGCALPCRRILHAVPGMRSQPRGDRRSVQDPFQPPAAPRRQVGFLKKEIGRFFFAKNRPLRKRKVESAVPRGDGGARATARQTWRRDPRAARCTRTTRVSASLCAVSVAAPRDRVFAARQRALVRDGQPRALRSAPRTPALAPCPRMRRGGCCR